MVFLWANAGDVKIFLFKAENQVSAFFKLFIVSIVKEGCEGGSEEKWAHFEIIKTDATFLIQTLFIYTEPAQIGMYLVKNMNRFVFATKFAVKCSKYKYRLTRQSEVFLGVLSL